MTIKYFLTTVKTVNGQEKHAATVISNGTLGEKELINHMQRKGSTVSVSDMKAVLQDLTEIFDAAFLEGMRINFNDMFTFSVSMQGTFDDLSDSFDQSKQNLYIVATVDKKCLKRFQDNARAQKIEKIRKTPVIREYFDLKTKTKNQKITPGDNGIIRGVRLKLDPANTDETIVLIDSATRKLYPVIQYSFIQPSEIIFTVPDLPSEVKEVTIRLTGRLRKKNKRTETSNMFGPLAVSS